MDGRFDPADLADLSAEVQRRFFREHPWSDRRQKISRSGRLIEITEEVLVQLVKDAHPDFYVSVEWGEPDEENVYTPTIRTLPRNRTRYWPLRPNG